MGEAVHVGGWGTEEIPEPSTQFCCKPKIKKNQIQFLKKRKGGGKCQNIEEL